MHRVVTGIQPSGTPHLGNYFGMIRPALDLARDASAVYFIADYHALTTVRDPSELSALTFDVAATWLALGLDPDQSTLYLQSDLPEVCELSWLIGCTVAKGLLNRGHAYKSVVDENRRSGRPDDAGATAGIFNYPLLMAADILIHEADVVPVGEDNRQHIEITRDAAAAFNGHYGDVFTIPDGRIDERVAVVPGIDGRKMSKSYGNVVPIFGSQSDVARRIKGIVTDSRRADEPKDPGSCNVFGLLRLVATEDAVAEVAEGYRSGSIGYGQAKDLLIEAHDLRFGPARERFRELRANEPHLRRVLAEGAERARGRARRQLERARAAVGIINTATHEDTEE